jgi:2-methylcitrate dehydratase PrpD
MTVALDISKVLEEFRYENIPEHVLTNAKMRFLDIIGISLAASEMKFAKIVFDGAKKFGNGNESTIIGFGEKVPMPSAVFVNGTFAHGIDFDDTHPPTMTHASVATIPTALSVGECLKASGKRILESYIIGAELMVRIASVAAMDFIEKGFHGTSIVSPFGAALTAGKLMDIKKIEMANALGLCGSQASGITEPVWDGTWTKFFHLGRGQHSGVIAVLLAKEGYIGTKRVFEGENGFYKAYTEKHGPFAFDFRKIVKGIGEEWETLKFCIKPYPC